MIGGSCIFDISKWRHLWIWTFSSSIMNPFDPFNPRKVLQMILTFVNSRNLPFEQCFNSARTVRWYCCQLLQIILHSQFTKGVNVKIQCSPMVWDRILVNVTIVYFAKFKCKIEESIILYNYPPYQRWKKWSKFVLEFKSRREDENGLIFTVCSGGLLNWICF